MFPYTPDSPDSIYHQEDNATACEIAPSVWVGSYSNCLGDQFLRTKNVKIIINCSPSYAFFHELEYSDVSIPSDLVVLSLDPSFNMDSHSSVEQTFLMKTVAKFNRVLQNYITHFYVNNQTPGYDVIHKSINNTMLQVASPILAGNLQASLFQANRIIKLLRNINSSVEVLIVSREPFGNRLTTALGVSYLMDSYGFDLPTSLRHIQLRDPKFSPLNINYYEDLLIAENLKKFHTENLAIKQNSGGVLTSNFKLKRRQPEDLGDEEDAMEIEMISNKKRR
ncbi:hypothetical protein CAAN1_24S01398 [[Candida] anglica]|uniref:Uncharacterized protein n=1 Tax=[Candida] anglica TaxID=148631 RepID=A0ABP0EH65_9ASCO